MSLRRFTIEIDDELAGRLTKASKEQGWIPESLISDCVAQHFEVALRHRVLIERLEAVDAHLATLAKFVGEATSSGGAADLEWICKYRREKSASK